ncbi:hypothetical protein RF11_13362 [Thelohanellus kitauei]|uniref:DOCKER domain-containing protein n=1 Tax=Thelohanellus kitauei TaxID=669202 RepID=A0A0C2MVQ3_THEKT|nr:hypothetical protein RF11_13362 [Thelohanellus kitauei]
MKSTIQEYVKNSTNYTILLMKLQGNLLAAVNGGISLITKKYLQKDYFKNNESELHKAKTLKKLLSEFMEANKNGIMLYSTNVDEQNELLFEKITEGYNETVEQFKKLGIECPLLKDDLHKNRNKSKEIIEKNPALKYAMLFKVRISYIFITIL